MKANKEAVGVAAVKWLKASPFKATAIKVELEAQLNRYESSEYDCLDRFLAELADRLGQRFEGSIEDDDEAAYCLNPFPEISYAQFYNDGSVDSELTITVKLDKPENVLLLPVIIEAWNGMCEEVGDGVDVYGAGMHMALLNTKDYSYNAQLTGLTAANLTRFRNFRKSMQLLLPALFFLASHNEVSRALEYRTPRIEYGSSSHGYDKFNAIWYAHGALEFRVFETCYDNPQAILDNVVVIRNCMRYWRRGYKPSGLSKVTNTCSFGNDQDHTIKRFYMTTQHIDLLNAGLTKLKPSYYTVSELKAQRNFKTNRVEVSNLAKKRKLEAEMEYQEYEERFGWRLLQDKHELIRDKLQTARLDKVPASKAREVEAEAEKAAEVYVSEAAKKKQPLDSFVNEKVMELQHQLEGQFTLIEA